MYKQLIIAGFHRSGTSMLAQELFNAGLFLGKRLMSPNISNADGYFEDMDFYHLHEKLLRFNQSSWQHTGDDPLLVSEDYKREMHRLVDVRDSEHNLWGFKDPRSILFLPEWYAELSKPCTVVIYRHYSETSCSLLHRAAGDWLVNPNADQLIFWQDGTLAYRMWLAYNRRLIKHIRVHPETTIVVSQDAILQGFPIVKELTERFHFDLDLNASSSIDASKLSDKAKNIPLADDALQQELDAVWQELQALSIAPAKEKPIQKTTLAGITLGDIAKNVELVVEKKVQDDPLYETLSLLNSNDIPVSEKIKKTRQSIRLFFSVGQQIVLIDTIKHLLEQEQEDIELWKLLGDLHRLNKEEEKANNDDLNMMAVMPSVAPWNYLRIAEGYLTFYRFDKADLFIKKAIKGNPNNPSFYLTRALMEVACCRYDSALTSLDKAIDVFADNVNGKITALFRKGEIYNLLDDSENLSVTIETINELKGNLSNTSDWIDMKLKYFTDKEEETVNFKVQWKEKFTKRLDEQNFLTEFEYALQSIDDPLMKSDLIERIGERLEKLVTKETKKEIIKTIYILWLQGFDNAPEIVRICLRSWIEKNPLWNVVLLDESSLKEYINIENITKSKTISKASLSDIIRISLLKQYGGLWVDATTYCNRPLDDWLVDYISSGFFAFNFEKDLNTLPDRPISSWFLYAEKDSYIIDCWYTKTMEYCRRTSIIGIDEAISTKEKWIKKNLEEHYFWFHYIFEDLYTADNKFKTIWDNSPKLSEKSPHYLQNSGMLSHVTDNVKNHIDFKKTPLYKLTYRFDKLKYNNNSNLHYLLYPKYTTMNIAANNYKVKDCIPNVHFIHIGKCGGTALMISFKDQEIKLNDFHLQKPTEPKKDDKYIIWIRNPLHRFVSAFNFSLALINTSTTDLKKKELTIYNCLAPGRILYKMKHDHTFSKEYDDLISFFFTPNNLAEALSSEDKEIRSRAVTLMNHPMEHINQGIGWYLNNGDFINENKEKILFVGKTETMKTDVSNLSKLLETPIGISKNRIRENTSYSKYLSPLAIKNILNFYHDTDYKALRVLHKQGWIDNNTYRSYFTY